jgi:hypothetical protein
MAKCSGITRAGTACKGVPIEGSQWCFSHHPDHDQDRRRHGARGGKRGGRGRPVTELAALRNENAEIRRRLLGEDLAPNVASVAVQSLNVDARLIVAALKAREQEELEARLGELEALLEQRAEGSRYGA